LDGDWDGKFTSCCLVCRVHPSVGARKSVGGHSGAAGTGHWALDPLQGS
jgi:hypothetical protein